jgi:putative membrane protein
MIKISLILKGFVMGIAEAIPGVSGGTIAFIAGIYEELIETIKSFTPANIKLIFTNPKGFWQAINGPFLMNLLLGMGGGLVFGVFVISHLLETQGILLWSFFFGLVLASAIYLARGVKWSMPAIILLLVGTGISYIITTLSPSSGSDNPLYLFLAGSIAISALMLPGISGSFMLLLFGLYHTIIFTVKDLLSGHLSTGHLVTLGSFALGALFGLFSFARVLSYLFKHYAAWTMAFLIGILLGSLNKLWPWKLITNALNKETALIESIGDIRLPDTEAYKILTESNILPNKFASYSDPMLMGAIVFFILGMGIVALIDRLDASRLSS